MEKPDLEKIKPYLHLYPFPTDIIVETSAICNLNCIMCPQDSLPRKKGEMSFELWKKIIDETVEKSPDTRIWPALMGEPFLMGNRIFKMLNYAKDKGVKYISLASNLNAFKESMLDDLFACRLDGLVVGMDAATTDTYAKIRVNGDFGHVCRMVELIAREKEKRSLDHPQILLQYIVMDENEHEEQAFIDYWVREGLDLTLRIKPATSWGGAVKPWHGILDEDGEIERIPCSWILRQMAILWDGQVTQCDGDWMGETNYGNVNDQSLEEIWTQNLRTIHEKHLSFDFSYPPCESCSDWLSGMSKIIKCREESQKRKS